MEEKKSSVVYSCDTLNGSTDQINSPEVIAYAANLPGVSTIWFPSDISLKRIVPSTSVVLTNLAHLQGYSIEHCIDEAYKVIAARTGKMINGTFVKDAN